MYLDMLLIHVIQFKNLIFYQIFIIMIFIEKVLIQ